MLGPLRVLIQRIAGTDSRRNISVFVLTLLGMLIGAIYTLANDGWFSGKPFSHSNADDIVATDEGENKKRSEEDPSIINSFGDDTINVNSSEARDIAIEGAK